MPGKWWIFWGAVFAGLSVALGSLAAHGLDGYFAKFYADAPPRLVAGIPVPAAQKYLTDFKTGAEYQMYHALGLIGIGLLAGQRRRRAFDVAGVAFVIGILLFSGMLYLLTLTGQRWLGMIVPIGGTAFIVGWCSVIAGLLGRDQPQP